MIAVEREIEEKENLIKAKGRFFKSIKSLLN